jgi:PAS domain S-box-containing protein
MHPATPSAALMTALAHLGPHDHLCSIYESQEEQFHIAMPFIRIGLERGEQCLYIAAHDRVGAVREAMRREGIDVDRATHAQALTVLTPEQTYLTDGSFHLEAMVTVWEDAIERAWREGFTALRTTGETEWVLRGAPGLERWMEYESRVMHTLAARQCLALCQYHRRRCPPALLREVIRTHPTVIYRGTVCRNLYYVPPEEMLAPNQTEREVERLLTTLRERETVESAFQHQRDELRASEHRLATQYAITRILAESDTLADAMPPLLQAIGERLAWEWGALWTIDRDAGVLRCEHIWHAPSLEAATFDAISRQTAGLPGRGLKERVWQTAEPTWMADVTQDPHFMRAPIAARMGLQGAVAFPILLRGETLGVMEFFSRAISPPDAAQLAMLSAIGNQIGQFVERERAEEQLRRSEAYLAEGQRISHTGSWAVQLPSEDVFWSPEVYRIYGLDPATTKLSQQMAFQLIHPDDRPCVQAAFERALRENSEYAVEHRAILADGSIKHLHALGHPVVNESGTLT